MKLSFTNKNTAFNIALKQKVDEHFKSTGEKKTGNGKLFLKTAILLTSAVILYSLLVFTTPPLWASLTLCAIFGFNLATIGFNIMHDGAHGSYSDKKWVNNVMGFTLNIMGGNNYLWKLKHNGAHHSFTNIIDHDDDIDLRPVMRTNENHPKKWFHRYQHIYWAPLYCLSYWSMVFGKNFKEYFKGMIGVNPMKKIPVKDKIVFWVSKTIYLSIFIVVPSIFLGFERAITGYIIVSLICGFILSIIFQLAHVIEGTDFPLPDEENRMEEDWIVHQINTTANFATDNKVVSWLVGGLNFQVEHHLFPGISHVHYPALSKKVKEVCLEYGINYIEYPTLSNAIRSHVGYLKTLGA